MTRMERFTPREIIQPEVKLANDLIDGLVTAIPIIRQQQFVPEEMLTYGRGIMNETRRIAQAQGWSMGRLMVKAIEIIDAPKEAA